MATGSVAGLIAAQVGVAGRGGREEATMRGVLRGRTSAVAPELLIRSCCRLEWVHGPRRLRGSRRGRFTSREERGAANEDGCRSEEARSTAGSLQVDARRRLFGLAKRQICGPTKHSLMAVS